MTDAIHAAYDVYKTQVGEVDVDVGAGVLAYVHSETSTVAILIPNYSPELIQAAHDVLRAFPAVSLQYNVRRLVDVDDGAFCYFEITTPWYTNSWPQAHGEYWHVACTTSPTTPRYHITTWTDAIYILSQLRIRDPLAFPLPTSHANSGIVPSNELLFHDEMRDELGDGE